ncbi:MAG TPA: sensor histidine kinase, partial [Chloroflexota bacterium]|nr:sensor histidine kinase [Chloroflexota bacterium]
VAETRGHRVTELLPAIGEAVNGTIGSRNEGETEFELGCGRSAQQYRMNVTPLRGKHGEELGHLLLLHDITSERRTQARLLEQERVVATLQERERLARELHDGVGQVLGYLSLQTHAVRKRLQEGEGEKVDSQLLRLATVAQNAHGEVRESIFALTAASSANWSFLSTLRRYLNEFQANYGLDAELTVADGVDESLFDSHSAVQLLRVVQEAVTNARKHAGACTVRVIVDARGGHACIKICDDGCGFDADGLGHDRDGHFGLAFMRERMAHIGGSVEIESRPGGGTQVTLDAPVRNGDGR